jgi:hypothetical protein
MKWIAASLLLLILTLPLTACSSREVEPTSSVSPSQSAIEPEEGGVIVITLGDTITVSGPGAVVDDSKITIFSSGTYSLSGTLDDGQIIVNTPSEDKETVKLILNGVDITCSTSAPIYVINAEKTAIDLADGSENYIADGDYYLLEDSEADEPNAAVFSKDDLAINGNGSLAINANYNNGIQSKDDLEINGGNITVNAVNDGIKGRDSITIKSGNITVVAGGDGLQSNNDEDSERGYISIDGGTFDITAGEDGIQAETILTISGGDIDISSGGGSANAISRGNDFGNPWGNRDMGTEDTGDSDDSDSTKGLKAGIGVTIAGGTIDIDSCDDSVHSNDRITVENGTLTLSSGDDGMHADSTLEINGGDINITKCYEGLESAVITINNGNIHVVASDDGINAVSSDDGSTAGGWPMPNDFESSGNNHLYINGGYIVFDAAGDGIDVNGQIDMTGGTVIVNGPTQNYNGALDYLGAFKVTGGFLVAAGSSGMAQAPTISSTQYSVMLNLPSVQPAGTMIHIESEDGEEVLTFVPTKAYQSVVLCSPELENSTTYIVYTAGSSTGAVADGLYSGGTYAAGTQLTDFTVSSVVTAIGSSGGGFPSGFPGGQGGNMPPGGMPR